MSPTDERDWLVVGQVVKPHGVHGDLVVDVITDFPERLADGVRFGVGEGAEPTAFHEAFRVRYHKGKWLLSVADLRDRDAAEDWRGRYLFLPEQALDELPPGFVYEHHLVGLGCRSPGGEDLGTVTGLDQGPGQHRLVVRRGRREFLVPYVPEIVTNVDLDGGIVTIDAPPGLLDDEFTTA
ncbi:MAG TPA: ribosome maturation factor RimM [Candidatus Sulfomarinibacteraceae bacterium]|nr:ribosome maturation factor RimM [Candidatus Sulfomarinibacteraceae bacterium]